MRGKLIEWCLAQGNSGMFCKGTLIHVGRQLVAPSIHVGRQLLCALHPLAVTVHAKFEVLQGTLQMHNMLSMYR